MRGTATDCATAGTAEPSARVTGGRVATATQPLGILMLSPHYPPDVAATGQLVAELAEDLAAAGHRPVVVASRPHYSDTPARAYRLLEREWRNGVEIHWLGVPLLGRRGLWSRLLPFAGYFFAAALRCAPMRGIDIVFAQSTPPLLAGLLARLLSVVPGRRFVYNLQDVYPEIGQALGVLGDGRLLRATARIERWLRRQADVVAVLSEDMRERCAAADPQLASLTVIPNWADTRSVYPVAAPDNAFVREHGLEGRFVVMYSGNLGRAHGVEMLPDVAAELADLDDLIMLVVGDGPQKASVRRRVSELGLENVRFLPYQDKSRLHESLSAADVGLILQRRSVLGLVVPSKLYGILASGRSAVAAVPAQSEVARVIEREKAGFVVAPDDAHGLAAAIRNLHRDRDLCRRMGENARAAAQSRYDRRQVTGDYARLFSELSS